MAKSFTGDEGLEGLDDALGDVISAQKREKRRAKRREQRRARRRKRAARGLKPGDPDDDEDEEEAKEGDAGSEDEISDEDDEDDEGTLSPSEDEEGDMPGYLDNDYNPYLDKQGLDKERKRSTISMMNSTHVRCT